MEKERIATVVVTYNRKESLKKNIICLLRQTHPIDRIYIIDNHSNDGTEEYLRDVIKESRIISYIRLSKNIGGSGGFYYGIKKAYEDGADYIWGMDDDAYPEKKALEEIIKVKGTIDNQIPACFWSNCNKDKDFETSVKVVDGWMFVGFFLDKRIIQRVGFPHNDYFIYFDDYEYADRIIKNGFKIYKVRDSIIDHKDGNSEILMEINVLGKKKIITGMPSADWKLYYMIRNNILRFSYKDWRKYYNIFVINTKYFLKLLVFQPKRLNIFFRATMHGIIGKSGIIVTP